MKLLVALRELRLKDAAVRAGYTDDSRQIPAVADMGIERLKVARQPVRWDDPGELVRFTLPLPQALCCLASFHSSLISPVVFPLVSKLRQGGRR